MKISTTVNNAWIFVLKISRTDVFKSLCKNVSHYTKKKRSQATTTSKKRQRGRKNEKKAKNPEAGTENQ